VTAPILVLHDVGDAGGGAPWRAALEEAGWPGPVIAPDLPGHAGAPPPVGGDYELAAAALDVLPLVPPEGERPVVLGVGVHGWAASIIALGGRASALVLVDGLGRPWLDARERMAETRRWLRAIAADEDAIAPPPPGADLDPRLRHGMPPHGSRRLAERAARAMPVPALLIETADDGAADELAPLFKSGATVARVPDRTPTLVAGTVCRAMTRGSVPGMSEGA